MIYVVTDSNAHYTSQQAILANQLMVPNSNKKADTTSANTKPAVTPVTRKEETKPIETPSMKPTPATTSVSTQIKNFGNQWISANHKIFLMFLVLVHSIQTKPKQSASRQPKAATANKDITQLVKAKTVKPTPNTSVPSRTSPVSTTFPVYCERAVKTHQTSFFFSFRNYSAKTTDNINCN